MSIQTKSTRSSSLPRTLSALCLALTLTSGLGCALDDRDNPYDDLSGIDWPEEESESEGEDEDEAELGKAPSDPELSLIRGEVIRAASREGGEGTGDIWITVSEECQGPTAVAGLVILDAVLERPGDLVEFTVAEVPHGDWFVDAWLDDNGNGERDFGDLVTRGGCEPVTIDGEGRGGVELNLVAVSLTPIPTPTPAP